MIPQAFRFVEPLETRQLLSYGPIAPSVSLPAATQHTPFAPVTVEASNAVAAPLALGALPSSFDLRTGGYVTSVKDQGNCGSCWTFATYGSAESSALMEGVGSLDLSENNLKDWHGFDWGPCDGGNSSISEAYLSRGSGPVTEANDPYHDYDDRSGSNPNYPQSQWVTQMLRYDTAPEMKNALMTQGALYTSMYWDDLSYRDTDDTYYYTGTGHNHGVTIVGWDDNKVTAASTPGAWLIKNSWGTSWGDGGYFWLSYADTAGAKSGESFNGIMPASTYDNVYYWDDFGDVTQLSMSWGMNRFVTQNNEAISAIGFFTEADSANYTISLYDTYSGGKLSGLLTSATGTEATAGWHTVSMSTPPHLTSGSAFYVVLNITNGGSQPMATDEQEPGYDSNSSSAPGESWYSYDGAAWTDLTSYESTANFCIKAYTKRDTGNAPTDISLSSTSVAENLPAGTLVGKLSATDPDPGEKFTYSLINGAGSSDNGSFVISGDQLLTTAIFDYETKSSYSIRLRVTDSTGLHFDKAFTISVTNANEPPTDISLSSGSIAENLPTGTLVGLFSTVGADPSDTFSYSLINGSGPNDNTSFSIVGNRLQTAVSFDYETKSVYSILVRAADAGGITLDKTFTVYVTNVNERPTSITLTPDSISENQPAGTVVGTLGASDPDASDSASFSLTSGTGSADNSLFSIVGSQLKTAQVFDYETRNVFSILVRVTDGGGLTLDKSFTIHVTNVNEQPTGISLSRTVIVENQPVGAVVGQLSATDPDVNDVLTYSLIGGTGSADNGWFTIVGNQLQAAAVLDYETKSTYSIRIGVSDSGGLSCDKAFTITVTDVNEAPSSLTISNSSIAENQPIRTAIGALTSTDPDAHNTFTYSLVPGDGSADNASFSMIGYLLMSSTSFDYETKSQYSVRIRTTDQGGLWLEKAFTINVTNVNEAPTDIALSGSSVAENQPAGTAVGTVSANDPDAGDSITYSLATGTGPNDNGLFAIVGNQLQTAASLDYETKSSYSVLVCATDSSGLSYTKPFAITVTNVNEAPTSVELSNNSIAENQPASTLVGTLSGTDPDAGDAFTYSLVGGIGSDDNGSFNIVGNQLQSATSFDYETKTSYSILIQVSDAGRLSYERPFTVNVTNVNEAPTDIALTNSVVADKQPIGTLVGALSSLDPDLGESFTYTLVPGTGATDNALFQIVGNELRTNAVLNYVTQSHFSVRIHTADSGGSGTEKVFEVNATQTAVPWQINGTTGNDVITLNLAGGLYQLVVNGLSSTKSPGDVSSITISGLDGSDVITVGSSVLAGVTIDGGTGNDSLTGGGGSDFIIGGGGADTLSGGNGMDTLSGGAGADMITGGGGNDSLIGGAGNDTLYGSAGNDMIDGGVGNDLIYGGAGSDSLGGSGGNDTLYGGAGMDTLVGGAGNDLIYGQGGDDWIYVSDGPVVIFHDTVVGGLGTNHVSHDAGDTILDAHVDIL